MINFFEILINFVYYENTEKIFFKNFEKMPSGNLYKISVKYIGGLTKMKSENKTHLIMKDMIEKEVNIEKRILLKECKVVELNDLPDSPRGNYLRGLFYYVIEENSDKGEDYFSIVRQTGNDELLMKLYRTYLNFSDEYIDLADECLKLSAAQGNELAIELMKK